MKKILILIILIGVLFCNQAVTSRIAAAFDDDYRAFRVLVGDLVTPPIDSYFLQGLTNFTLISNVVASTKTVLNYTIFVGNIKNV